MLGALRWIFRDALAARCGAASRLSTSPETADKLARALTRAQLMALLETVEGLEQARLRNMNAPCLSPCSAPACGPRPGGELFYKR